MKAKISALVLVFFSFSLIVLGWVDINYRVLDEEGCPVKIEEFKVGVPRYGCSIKFKNISEANVEAVKFRIFYFDPFDKLLAVRGGVYIDEKKKPVSPQLSEKGSWTFESIIEDLRIAYTAIAYVSDVRFSDGSLWAADTEYIIQKVLDMMNVDMTELIKD